MDYSSISTEEAIDIIKNSKSNCVIRNTVMNGGTFVDRVDKKTAIRIIKEASEAYYNSDDYVGNIDLSFADDTKVIKLLFGN